MNKSIKITLIICGTILAIILLAMNGAKQANKNLTVGGSSYQVIDKCTPFPNGTSTPRVTAAGTHYYIEENNAFFITANATSTFECSVGNADMADLHLFFVASTSAARPTWDYEFSFDGNEWYSPTLYIDGADFNTIAGTSTYAYGKSLEINATTTINAQITPLASPKIRVNVGAGGGAASVYPEIIRRNKN